ncbi:ABC transporter substrate-binding protein [Leisingera sp. HS039]|uniref:heme/hemin ABC transporter substrate-binding protein n=1 Tax=unclassified Leisingera TaxID=2614906 RepID=UPI001070BF0B|nr:MULTISPECIES: ABC transporter substrate-binding protein [unclassified Leisingera]MBQ4824508.1 ABC transporter substrate-binding protein [Leisingera sp. HS039]QBR38856.1 hemin ABC transporter substrate-binding protein [Leisingera sp. NJS201]
MTVLSRLYLGLNLMIALVFAGHAALADPASRIVSVGGSVTEIVYALDQQHRLIARDTTSIFPAEARQLPDIGYQRALAPEGVLSVAPDMILAIEGAGPPETLDVLKAAEVAFISVPEDFSAEGIARKIRTVGAALDQQAAAEVLAGQVSAEIAAAQAAAAKAAAGTPRKVLFVLSTQGGRIMAGGADTAADSIIRLAGGVNAVTGFAGYKPMGDEAIAQAAPEVILVMERGGDHGIRTEDLLAIPAIQPTPAAQNGAIVRMNGLHLIGFGPRTASAVTELNRALYGGRAQDVLGH